MAEPDGTPTFNHLFYLLRDHAWMVNLGPPYSTHYNSVENTTAVRVGEFLGLSQTLIDFHNADGTFVDSTGTTHTSPRGEPPCQTVREAHCAHGSDLAEWKALYQSFGTYVTPRWTDAPCCSNA